jgi:hypothetical protein
MQDEILKLVINIIINFIDVLIVYYIYYSLVDLKLKFSIKLITLSILYGVTLGFMGMHLYNYTCRIISTSTILVIFKWLSKRRIHDVVIMYVIYFTYGICIQILLLLILNQIFFSQMFIFLLTQILTLLIFILSYKKFQLHKVFNIIQKELLLELLIFNIGIIILFFTFYINFEYTNSYSLYFTLLLVFICIGLYHTISRVSYYTNEMPAQIHDVKNILIVLQILAESNSYKQLKAELDTAVEILGLDTNVDNTEWEGYNNGILAIVKKKQKNNNTLFLTDIKYDETNSKVGFLGIGYMLGVLLDSAIETGTKKPILVKININSDILIISVAHEYERKYNDGFQKMFQKKYTTKEKLGQKHGLPNLSMFVNKHDGEINISYELHKKQKCNYLIVTIDMGKRKIGGPKWNEEILSLS